MSVDHHSFTITRTYPYTPAQVFSAWADPEKKKLWFGVSEDFSDTHAVYDFRVGGREHNSATHNSGVRHTFDSEYTNIVQDERIVYTYSMTLNEVPLSTSLTCVTFAPVEGGTILEFTEHGVFFDGADAGTNREIGTASILDDFARALDGLFS